MNSRTIFAYTPPGASMPPYLCVLDVDGAISVTVRGEKPVGDSEPPYAAIVMPEEQWRQLAIALNNEFRRRSNVKVGGA